MDETKIGFYAAANALRQDGARYQTHIPDAWRQGRTAYGGITAGLSLVAAQKQFPGLAPFRSATINFVGPVTHDPQFSSRLLRQGKNVTSIQTEAHIKTSCVASTNFIFAAPRLSELSVDCPAPSAPPPGSCEPFTPPEFKAFVPAFFNRFETQLIAGARPVSGHDEGYIRVWSRHKDPASRQGAASLLAIGDVLPPAAMPMLKKMGPVSSVNWIFTVLTDTVETQDGWWQIEARLTAAQNGYSSQVMRIWNTEGLLVAEGMQCIAIFA